jgi:hypothetical protein
MTAVVAPTRSTAGPITAGPDRPRSQNWFSTGASQLIRNVRPHIPVTEASCRSGRDPYCEYAALPAVPKGFPIVPKNSVVVTATGKANVLAMPFSRGDRRRSTANGRAPPSPRVMMNR